MAPLSPRASPVAVPNAAVKLNVRATPDLALEGEPAAEGIDQLARDRQPEAGAAVAAGRGRVGLREGVEEPLLGSHRDAGAGVLHGHLEHDAVGSALGEVDGDGDGAAVGELDGVGPEVGEDLLPPHGVAADVRRDARGHHQPQVEALVVGEAAQQPDRLLDDGPDLEVDQLELELARPRSSRGRGCR